MYFDDLYEVSKIFITVQEEGGSLYSIEMYVLSSGYYLLF